MKRLFICGMAAAAFAGLSVPAGAQTSYYPGEQWERRAPKEVGLDAALLDSAIAFILAQGSDMPRDLRAALNERNQSEPYNEIIGPTKERGEPNGLIIRHGYIVAEWGETHRVDMTFSVTKSFLSAVAGLAYDRGLIGDMDDPVKDYVADGGFDSPHNSKITWRQLLQQTNEWQGTLWDKPDVADRREGRDRRLQPPGAFWEYNDVRVNRSALALLRVWNRALPAVLEEYLMDPIGASDTWQWHGYRNSFVTIDGEQVQSVSGGGHWGGGMWINSIDLARFGYLYLREGRWRDRQILSRGWIEMTRVPTDVKPTYGYMWWLNTDGGMWPSVPETSYAALGGGRNFIWIDPEHDLVVVARWMNRSYMDAFLARILASLDDGQTH